MSQFKPKERVITILDDPKFSIRGDTTTKGAATLKSQITTEYGNPRLIVFPSDPDDNDPKPIIAAMNPCDWSTYVEMVKYVANLDEPSQFSIPLLQGPPQKQYTAATIVVGKDAEGWVFIAVLAKDRAKKRFFIKPSQYMEINMADGTPAPASIVGKITALGWITAHDNAMQTLIPKYYKRFTKDNNGGNNRNYSDNNSYSNNTSNDSINNELAF